MSEKHSPESTRFDGKVRLCICAIGLFTAIIALISLSCFIISYEGTKDFLIRCAFMSGDIGQKFLSYADIYF